MTWEDFIPENIKALYEIHDIKHAAAILANEFPTQFDDICKALSQFRLKVHDITTPGGRESNIPKKFSSILRPLGWKEDKLIASFVVDDLIIKQESHKVDYIKGRIALDLEWNSKDQTYDRDLFAFRHFFEYDKISLGVIITRSNDLDPLFKSLGSYKAKDGKMRKYSAKYGKSTTQMSKLLPRLSEGRNGGCPILVFGITQRVVEL